MLGLKPEKDASLIIAIKEAVKKLGSKDAILASIINMEQTADAESYIETPLNSATSYVYITS